MIGIVKEDIVHTVLEGYSIDGIIVSKQSEDVAKQNVGKKVKYELCYDGYRQFGMFSKKFYEQANIIQ